jgi:outer membrane protein OmpA-like peptidoglycan-associated protein
VRPALATAACAALLAALSGCATPPRNNATLEEARVAYRDAAADPQVARAAELPLRRAQESLVAAENLQRQGADPSAVTHQAYLARRYAETATALGQQAAAQDAIATAGREREQVLLQSRTREAEAAQARAEQERLVAQQAQRSAEQAGQSAAQAQASAEQRSRELATERARAQQLQAELADMKAKPTDRGMVLTLGDVLFDTGRATLKPGAMRSIDRLATFLSEHPERRVRIEGYTDSVGRDDYNQQLSEQRADAVRQALLQRNVRGERIETRGLGESDPVASNDTAAGRQQNRRVEVLFSDERGTIAGQPPQ